MVPSTANLKSYVNIVKEKFFLRRLITISRQIIDSAAHEDVDVKTLLNDAEQKIYEIAQGKTGNEPSKLSDIVVDKVLGRIENLQQDTTGELKPISTGFSELDAVLGGLNKSDLILIGARPGMGKTSFALSLARNVAINGHKVLFFSMEMTKEQLAQRVISTETRISSEKLRDGRISTEEWLLLAKAASRLNDCLLYFDDNSNITVADMKATARRLREVRCVFVDYLGLVRPGSRRENRVQEVSEITRNLKLMAKELTYRSFAVRSFPEEPKGVP
jgi:replicative DNA helicase